MPTTQPIPAHEHHSGSPMHRLLPIVALFLIAPWVEAAGTYESYNAYLESVYRETVPLIQPEELHEMLREQNREIVVLDTRSRAERTVSYLPGSRFVGYEEFNVDHVADVPRTATVVLYCAVGYRSERVGEALQDAGFTSVLNLYGGIIEWHNRGLPLVDAHAKPARVHGYSPRWGRWVESDRVTYSPDPEE